MFLVWFIKRAWAACDIKVHFLCFFLLLIAFLWGCLWDLFKIIYQYLLIIIIFNYFSLNSILIHCDWCLGSVQLWGIHSWVGSSTCHVRGGEWYTENSVSRKILFQSWNLGRVLNKSRNLVFLNVLVCVSDSQIFGCEVSESRILFFGQRFWSKAWENCKYLINVP